MKRKFFQHCFLFLLFTLFLVSVKGQSYGLVFGGNEVVQDKRTGLDLSANEPLCFDGDFELKFDLSFFKSKANYFGYIFRMIDQNKRNIDLIYDERTIDNKHFKLIVGDKISDITFNIDLEQLYRNWYTMSLSFNVEKKEITLTVDGQVYTHKNAEIGTCYKILFGANNYKEFKVTDVPPIKIKDIEIYERNKKKYQWRLYGSSGTQAEENVSKTHGLIHNPVWIRTKHHDWELLQTFRVNGPTSTAFNAQKDELYVVSVDSLITYFVETNEHNHTAYRSQPQHLSVGNYSIYSSAVQKLFNFYMDQKMVSTYNFDQRAWDKNYQKTIDPTNFGHINKFYSAKDSSLYILGGYGQFKYSGEVQRYSFVTNVWTPVKTTGHFTPRYLAGLGVTERGAYILGGYGSATGEQILNPKNIYEFNFFDVQTKTFKTLFELKPKREDFAFANSLIIDEKEGIYYALTFPNHKYNSSLQLIKGSLDTANYTLVGNEIPYRFHDISSFADLFYSPITKKFIAVTLFFDANTNTTTVQLYGLSGPPEASLTGISSIIPPVHTGYYILIGLLLLLPLVFFFYRRKRKVVKETDATPAVVKTATEDVVTAESIMQEKIHIKEQVSNSIYLFGDLQLFDRNGQDITKLFTPLLKELFLVVLLYTIRWERGISSEKLTDILWFDKSADSARNNRSVNIAKLKSILEKIDGCQISKETGYWKINAKAESIWIDYSQYLEIVHNKAKIDKVKIKQLTKIIQRGSFLSNVDYDWLDDFKSTVSNEIIDTYLQYAATVQIADDPEFLVELTNYIFYFDAVNEEAMGIKCKALVQLGKHSLAKTAFEVFCKEYKVLYGEGFGKSFNEVLS